jgi:AraC-like DNA-binding protein
MELSLHLISNIVLFVVCLAMGTMFLALPIPQKHGLRNYKISLKVLAIAYYLLGTLSILVVLFKLPDNAREHFTFTAISISSFQAMLFTSALVTLINARFVTFRYLVLQLFPFLIFIVSFAISAIVYSNPVITRLNEIGLYIKNPTLWIRFAFYSYYIFQLFFYTWIYFNQEKKYKQRAQDYFSDEVWLKLSWIRIAFLSALLTGTIALSSYFFPRKFDWIFNFVYSIFYLAFALEYIKYQKIFKLLQPALIPADAEKPTLAVKKRSRWDWSDLKKQIITNEYYLESGITIEELATRLKIGRTNLSNCINREENMNFNAWINNLRIEKAKTILLSNPDISLRSIAESVGYTEQANFSRQFRQITGYAPTLWRQQQQVS